MKKLLWLMLWGSLSIANLVDLKIVTKKSQSQPVLLWVIKEKDETIPEMVDHMKRALTFTKQCDVQVEYFETIPGKDELKKLKKERGFHLVLVLMPYEKGYEWRLYDTLKPTLHAARRYEKRGSLLRGWAYNICDEVWPLLIQGDGFFSTKIAFAQKVQGKNIKHIYVADFDGSYPERLVDTPTINVAPRWHYDRKHPMLFYSDFTPKNIRLMVVGLDKVPKVASNFDGVNMIPAFSRDGSKMVYCSSRGDGYCQLYYCEKDRIRNITNNTGNNVSPSLTADGSKVFFCSDFQQSRPELYSYDLRKDELERLTNGAHCETPRYSTQANKVAYCRSMKGTMQLFIYDVSKRSHQQLTFGGKSKQECCWSPCGSWIMYTEGDIGKAGRIALINVHDKKQRFITAMQADCSFPDWSPAYRDYPVFS